MQKWAVNGVASYLSHAWSAEVHVGGIRFVPIKKIYLDDVYVEDQQHDTLLFIPHLGATVAFQTLFAVKKRLVLDEVSLTDARIKLKLSKAERKINFQFILDYFKSSGQDTIAGNFEFSISRINIYNAHFSYQDLKYDDYTPCIDFDDVDVSHFNASLLNVKPSGDVFSFYANKISFEEKSGFKVKNFSTYASFSPDSMSFNKIYIQTPYSLIHAKNYSMHYDSISDFESYIERVRMKAEFENSFLSSNDIQYFAKELFGLNQKIQFKGNVKGTVSNLKGKDLNIYFGHQTRFEGDASLNGLPDVNTLFMNLNIRNFTTTKADLETIKEFPFNESAFIQLPDNISELGRTTFKGVFSGFYNDFVAYGNISTAIGYLTTDVNLKFNEQLDKSTYSGKISATNFDIGKFWRLGNNVGTITFNAALAGSGFKSEKVNATLSGKIDNVTLNKYSYQNINLDGNVARKLFTGSLVMDDANANVDFSGTVDFSQKTPLFDFAATIKKAALAKLNIINRDTSALFSTTATLKMRGFNFDDFDGELNLKNTHYFEEYKVINIPEIALSSKKENEARSIQLTSDVLDLSLSGKYVLSTVVNSTIDVLNKYLPPFILNQKENKLMENTSFVFNGRVKEINSLLAIFAPGFSISSETGFEGKIDRLTGGLELYANAPWINYSNIKTKALNISAETRNDFLQIKFTTEQMRISDSLILKNISIDADAKKTRSTVRVIIANDSTSNSRLLLNSEQLFADASTQFHFLPSTILIHGENWKISDANKILFDSTGIYFNNTQFSNHNQLIEMSGSISNANHEKLRISLNQFNTAALNQLLALFGFNIGGIATGNIDVASAFKKPIITGTMLVEKFSFNGDTLGDASANLNWITEKNTLHIDGDISQNERKSAIITGDYIFKPKHDELDFSITLDKISIQPLGHYLDGFASKLKGLATAQLHLYGKVHEPFLTGTAKLQRSSFLIDYLNTRYTILADEEIILNEKYFAFNKIAITDDFGNTGTVDGKIFHKNLDDFAFNLKVYANKLQCLNTWASQNELFYGKGFASGSLSVLGTLNVMTLNINLKTEAGTQIFIPLSNPNEIAQNNFITFITSDTIKAKAIPRKVDLTGINMNFQLEATPEAEVQLIFDSKIGDVMKGSGRGNLKMQINTAGDFTMYGDYKIESGDYLFTLQNIVNKRFKVQDGIIRWAGSPYDATIDINAKYNLRASTFDLLPDSSNRSRVPVEVLLHLKNNLMSPDVLFDINVPNAAPAIRSSLKSILDNEREMNRQVFSLMVLNRFSKPEGKGNTEETGSGNAVGQNLGEFVSQQLSNWASQLSSKFDIGVNYRPGDALNRDEFDVSVATELFGNRLAVESNVGVANGTNQTSNIIGDFNVEFKINKDGNLRARAFNKTNNNNLINNLNSQYTQGIGVFYRKEFDKSSELFQKKHKQKKNPNMDQQSSK